jgi:hypothetical protein
VPATPEQKARREIDADLAAAGWLVQSRDELDLTAGRGIAVREFAMKSGFGFADHLLYIDRKAIGAIEAKPDGTLSGVEAQSAKYAAGLPDNLPAHKRPLPFLFESNGSVTYFTNGLDPLPRSRKVFNFPRPGALAECVSQTTQLHGRLQQLPELDESGLWSVQVRAIRSLEASFARAELRALIQMATGSGKTFTAVNVAYRLLKFAGAKRILFLVDRVLYAGTRPLRLSLKDLRPPLAASPVQLWRAFRAVEADRVKGSGGQQLTDLVNLVRHALIPTFTLVPYREELRERYEAWLKERGAERAFTAEQREWLDRIAEHIATSLAIEPADFETGWFSQHGSLGKAHALFGEKLKPLMTDLNARLAA